MAEGDAEMQAQLEAARAQLHQMEQRMQALTEEAHGALAEARARTVEEQERNRWGTEAFIKAISDSKGGGGRPKSGPKPFFKKEPGEDYLIFQGHFDVWAELQGLTDDQKKKNLFTAFQGTAGRVARIFGSEVVFVLSQAVSAWIFTFCPLGALGGSAGRGHSKCIPNT